MIGQIRMIHSSLVSRVFAFIALTACATASLSVTQSATHNSSGAQEVIWLDASPYLRVPQSTGGPVAICGTLSSPFVKLGLIINEEGELLETHTTMIDTRHSCRSLFVGNFGTSSPSSSLLYQTRIMKTTGARFGTVGFSGFPSYSVLINPQGERAEYDFQLSDFRSGLYLASRMRFPMIARHFNDPSWFRESFFIDSDMRRVPGYQIDQAGGSSGPRLLWMNSDYALVISKAMFTINSPIGQIKDRRTGKMLDHTCAHVHPYPTLYERQGRLITSNSSSTMRQLYDPARDRVLFKAFNIYPSSHPELLIARLERLKPGHVLIDRDGRVLDRFFCPENAYALTSSGIALWWDRRALPSSAAVRAERVEIDVLRGAVTRSAIDLNEMGSVRVTQHPDRFVLGEPDGLSNAILDESLEVVFTLPPEEHPVHVTHDAKVITYHEPDHAYILYSPLGEVLKRFDLGALGLARPVPSVTASQTPLEYPWSN